MIRPLPVKDVCRIICTLALALFIMTPPATAEKFHGKIVKKRGNVLIKNSDGTEREPEESDYIAITDEEINTQKNGRAVVRFTNGSITVIGENSSLGIEKPTMFAHLRGKIMFAFSKISGPTRMVRTNSAVFGVRATSFILSKDEDNEMLALKEGLVNVESTAGKFEIHKQDQARSFENFKAGISEGAEKLKKEGDEYIKQVKEEYIAYKHSFLVKPDNVIRIKGNRVDEGAFDKSVEADFDDFEAFGAEFLEGFRETEK